MQPDELIQEINHLSIKERIYILERILHCIRMEEEELKIAADTLLDDYQNDDELTAFTALDAENFYETR